MLEINGKSTKKLIHDTAVSLIRKGGDQVKLVIRREIRPDKNLGIEDIKLVIPYYIPFVVGAVTIILLLILYSACENNCS